MSMRMFQRGKSKIWYVQFARGDYRSLKTTDKEKARKAFTILEREYLQGRLVRLEREETKSFSYFMAEYISERTGVVAKSTLRADKLALQKFCDFHENRPMRAITEAKLLAFRSHLARGREKTSVNNHIRHLKTALKVAVKRKYIKENPLEDFKTLKVDLGKPIYMTEEEVKVLIDKAQEFEEMKRAIPVMICCGLSRIDVCKPIIITDTTVQYRRHKTNRLVEIPIIDKLRPYIQDMRGIVRLVPWSHPDTVGHKFLEVSRAAGLKGISSHKVRHTFATLLLKAGVDIATVSKLLGHADVSITIKFYGHIVDELKREAMRKFNSILK